MKSFGPNNTITEILADMVMDGQAMTSLSLAEEEGEPPTFVVVCAQGPYAAHLLALFGTMGERIMAENQGDSVRVEYQVDADGNPVTTPRLQTDNKNLLN